MTGPEEPRKRKFEEHSNQGWVNKYDQPLPQVISRLISKALNDY